MTLHHSGYKHWEGHHLGIWRRRLVIAAQGLKSSLEGRWLRHVIMVCWVLGLIQVCFLFFLGQLLVRDSMVVKWLANLNPDLQNFARGLVGWLEEHPEISVRTTYNILFYYFATYMVNFTLIALAICLPHLITRDLASKAIVIYSAKAVTRLDYFLGKLGTVLGLMFLTWLGPLCAAWFFGNLLAPDWHFFWHSRAALFNTCAHVGLGMLVLSLLVLAISAISESEKVTVNVWLGWWLMGNGFVALAAMAKPWLKFLSFTYNLKQVSLSIFRLRDDLKIAEENIPILGMMLRGLNKQTNALWQSPHLTGALVALFVMSALACLLLAKRVKPE